MIELGVYFSAKAFSVLNYDGMPITADNINRQIKADCNPYMGILRTQLIALLGIGLCVLSAQSVDGQRPMYVEAKAEGVYWLETPKLSFTRHLAISNGNRRLPKDDHDESALTVPGYYHQKTQQSAFTRYPFSSIRVKKGQATFTTKTVKGLRFVFQGRWDTEYDEPSLIDDVPFLKGTLLTYRRGKLIKRETVKFNHVVNA